HAPFAAARTTRRTARVLALALLVLTPCGVRAQAVRSPDPGSFESYLKQRLPRLAITSDAKGARPLDWVPPAAARAAARHVDQVAGLVPPKFPFPQPLSQLPENDPKTREYERQLAQFQEDRQNVLQIRDEYQRALGRRRQFAGLAAHALANPAYL